MSENAQPLRLDLGAGTTEREGYVRVDRHPFPKVDVLCDLGKDPWPWPDNSVDDVVCSHMLEHLTPPERAHFANELFRVLKPAPVGKTEPKALIIVPHWCAARAYGDPTHQWPPVTEWTFLYWNKPWRDVNAPHLRELVCDFERPDPTYSLHPILVTRSVEHQQERLTWAKEAAQDMMQILIKREPKPA